MLATQQLRHIEDTREMSCQIVGKFWFESDKRVMPLAIGRAEF